MRDILFRGKRVDNGEWICGNLYQCEEDSEGYVRNLITPKSRNGSPYMVDDNTIGQYTGLIDKNGKRVYENDIVNCKTKTYLFEGYTIEWYNEDARFVMVQNGRRYAVSESFEYEVVGNVYDNHNMLTDKGEG